jgi:hypothetical protein
MFSFSEVNRALRLTEGGTPNQVLHLAGPPAGFQAACLADRNTLANRFSPSVFSPTFT